MRTKAFLRVICGVAVSLAACGDDENAASERDRGDAGHADAGDRDELDAAPSTPDAGSTPGEDASRTTDASSGEEDAAQVLDAALTDAGLDADASVLMQDVEIAFEARVGDEPFSCGASYVGLGTVTTLSTHVSDFRFYVHDVKLVRADATEVPVQLGQGSAWQYDNVALLDFEDRTAACATTGTAETNKSVWGKVPAGVYSGLSFVLGVPDVYNHLDTAGKDTPSPLNIQAMAWNWASGRKFLRIDMASTQSVDGGVPTDAGKFVVHLGATVCPKLGEEGAGEPGSCKNPNRPVVSLGGFDPASSKVVFDLAAVVSGSALDFNTAATATGCMSAGNDPECAPIFERFGLSLVSGLPDAAHPQSVFSVGVK